MARACLMLLSAAMPACASASTSIDVTCMQVSEAVLLINPLCLQSASSVSTAPLTVNDCVYACRYMSYGLCCGKMGDHFLGALPLFYTSKYLKFYKQVLLAHACSAPTPSWLQCQELSYVQDSCAHNLGKCKLFAKTGCEVCTCL